MSLNPSTKPGRMPRLSKKSVRKNWPVSASVP